VSVRQRQEIQELLRPGGVTSVEGTRAVARPLLSWIGIKVVGLSILPRRLAGVLDEVLVDEVDHLPYDETTYLQSLKRRGSHLAYKLKQRLPKAA